MDYKNNSNTGLIIVADCIHVQVVQRSPEHQLLARFLPRPPGARRGRQASPAVSLVRKLQRRQYSPIDALEKNYFGVLSLQLKMLSGVLYRKVSPLV